MTTSLAARLLEMNRQFLGHDYYVGYLSAAEVHGRAGSMP